MGLNETEALMVVLSLMGFGYLFFLIFFHAGLLTLTDILLIVSILVIVPSIGALIHSIIKQRRVAE